MAFFVGLGFIAWWQQHLQGGGLLLARPALIERARVVINKRVINVYNTGKHDDSYNLSVRFLFWVF